MILYHGCRQWILNLPTVMPSNVSSRLNAQRIPGKWLRLGIFVRSLNSTVKNT